jgi:hypothetical protein
MTLKNLQELRKERNANVQQGFGLAVEKEAFLWKPLENVD